MNVYINSFTKYMISVGRWISYHRRSKENKVVSNHSGQEDFMVKIRKNAHRLR